MKIGNSAEKPVVPPTTNGATSQTEAAAKSAAPATTTAIPPKADASAKIAISSEATNLLEKNGSSADFDAEKVARISSQIENKSFKINPEAIADKLIANAKEVLTKT